jgi:uncharacterized protein (DUF433 family)
MSSVTTYPHIVVDKAGVAHLGQTRYTVLHLAGEHYHYGWSAEELLCQHPDLRPGEVYAALTYIYDHYETLVRQLDEQAEQAELLRARMEKGLSRAELLARKKENG